MRMLAANTLVNAGQLYDEIIAAVPELAPTPTGPDGKLEAQFVIEQAGPKALHVHIPDEVDMPRVGAVIAAHKRRPERTVDPVSDARKLVKQRADAGDDLAKAVLTLLG